MTHPETPADMDASGYAEDMPDGRGGEVLPAEVYDFVSKTGLLATNHGGWFDKHGFAAINPMCDWANAILEKYGRAGATDPLHAQAKAAGYASVAEWVAALTEDRDLWKQSEETCAKHYDKLLDEIRAKDAEIARYRENLKHSQGRFLNINIALTSGGTKREAIAIADLGEDCIKGYLAYPGCASGEGL